MYVSMYIHKTYTWAYIIKYITAVIILNELFFVRSIQNKKSESFYFPFTYFFFDTLPSFLNYVISFCLKNFEHFLQGRSTCNKSSQLLFVWKVFNCPSLLKDNFERYRILSWWSFPPNSWNIVHNFLIVPVPSRRSWV